jgi:GT2 family glycosyltransferase
MENSGAIFVIIPVHNRREYTLECLHGLLNQTYPVEEVIVVDDGSNDNTADAIAEKYPQVTILQGDGNLWWVGSANKGLEYALSRMSEDDYVLMLNNDLVIDEDYIGNLVNAAVQFPNAIIGSVVSLQDDRTAIWSGGIRTNWWTGAREKINQGRSLDMFERGHVEKTSILTGRGVLFPANVYADVGIYSNRFIQYGGDTELPRRASLNGWELLVSYDAVVYNYRHEERGLNDGPYTCRDLYNYFFSVRSNFSLRVRFWSSWLCTENPIQFFSFFTLTLLRTFIRFFLLHIILYKPSGVLR